jgi:NAD(P)-dependent dehydrogenase (short-subunit alcohol dehydrogenase family)
VTEDFTGRVAIVTGAVRGLGLAVAARLHERGASVAVNVRMQRVPKPAARAIGERARPFQPTWPPRRSRIHRQADSGIFRTHRHPHQQRGAAADDALRAHHADEWRRALEVNLTAPFLLIQAALPTMKAQGYGRIVNISSTAGRMVSTLGGAHYTASKTGLLGLTRAAAKELGRYGITVNAVCPGMIDTELTRESASTELLEGLARGFPVPRLGTSLEVADLICFARLRERRLYHRRVPGHQWRRSHDVGAMNE